MVSDCFSFILYTSKHYSVTMPMLPDWFVDSLRGYREVRKPRMTHILGFLKKPRGMGLPFLGASQETTLTSKFTTRHNRFPDMAQNLSRNSRLQTYYCLSYGRVVYKPSSSVGDS